MALADWIAKLAELEEQIAVKEKWAGAASKGTRAWKELNDLRQKAEGVRKIVQAAQAAETAGATAGAAGETAVATETAVAGTEAAVAGTEAAVAGTEIAAGHVIPTVMTGVGVGTEGVATTAGGVGLGSLLTPVGWFIVALVGIAIVGGVVWKVTSKSSSGETKVTATTVKTGGGDVSGNGPQLSYFAPNSVSAGSTSTIQAVGSHFFAPRGTFGHSVTLVRSGSAKTSEDYFYVSPPEATVTYVSETEIDISAAWSVPPGTYDALLVLDGGHDASGTLHVADTNLCTRCLTVSG